MDAVWVRNFGLTLLATPLFALLVLVAIKDPYLLIEFWDLYLLFVGIPYGAGIALLLYAKKLRRADKGGA